MISFLAVAVLSFFTLCFGTYLADRFESCQCAFCADRPEQQTSRNLGDEE